MNSAIAITRPHTALDLHRHRDRAQGSFATLPPARPRFRTRARVLASVLVVAGFAASAAAKPKPRHQPDECTVQGIVEVLNDVLYQPYAVGGSAQLAVGQVSAWATFDIPAGKRLVIETITVQVALASGQTRVFFEPLVGTSRLLSLLSVASNGPDTFGTDYYIGTHQFKARIDADAVAVDEIRIRFGNSALTGGSMSATIYGYLVDL